MMAVYRVSLVLRVPTCPNLAPRFTDGRAQQAERARRYALRLLNPGAVKVFQRFDTVGGVVLHPLEDNQSFALLREDQVALHVKQRRHAQRLNLAFYQCLHTMPQGLLNFADAHRLAVRVHDVLLYHHLGKEVRLAAATSAMCALVTCRVKQRQRPARGVNADRHPPLPAQSAVARCCLPAPRPPDHRPASPCAAW